MAKRRLLLKENQLDISGFASPNMGAQTVFTKSYTGSFIEPSSQNVVSNRITN